MDYYRLKIRSCTLVNTWVALMLAASCAESFAAVPIYEDPQAGPTAIVHLINRAKTLHILRVAFRDSYRCANPTTLTTMDSGDNKISKVAADTPFTFRTSYFSLGVGVSNVFCAVTLTFVPKQGNEYFVESSASEKVCNVQILEALPGGGMSRVTAVTERAPRMPFFARSGFCEPNELFKN